MGASLRSSPSPCSDFLLPFKSTSANKQEKKCFSLIKRSLQNSSCLLPQFLLILVKKKVVFVRALDTSEVITQLYDPLTLGTPWSAILQYRRHGKSSAMAWLGEAVVFRRELEVARLCHKKLICTHKKEHRETMKGGKTWIMLYLSSLFEGSSKTQKAASIYTSSCTQNSVLRPSMSAEK